MNENKNKLRNRVKDIGIFVEEFGLSGAENVPGLNDAFKNLGKLSFQEIDYLLERQYMYDDTQKFNSEIIEEAMFRKEDWNPVIRNAETARVIIDTFGSQYLHRNEKARPYLRDLKRCLLLGLIKDPDLEKSSGIAYFKDKPESRYFRD